jgi:hypothetical protein
MSALPKVTSSVVSDSFVAAVASHRKRLLRAVFFACFLFLSFSPARAETDLSTLPAEFGEVIYRCNPKSPNQLFIIGMAHRDSLTGLSIPKVSRAQAEVYKLGQWLVQSERCELLLPEGFFATPATKTGKEMRTGLEEKLSCPESIDLKTLEEKLSDNRSFVNAELLLKRNYSLRLRQVEDAKSHRAVGELIHKLVNCRNDNSEYLRVKSQLDYLQEKRTAAMLQRIPEIIQAEFQQGNIKARKAIFTIGLSHLPKIIRYSEENKVRIYSPILGTEKQEVYTADLNLKKEKFGVSILLPQALAGDQKALKINGLDEMIARHRRLSSTGSSAFPRN